MSFSANLLKLFQLSSAPPSSQVDPPPVGFLTGDPNLAQLVNDPFTVEMASRNSRTSVPARKAGKSTSYTAVGLAPPDTSAELGSSQPTIIREVVPDLISPVTRRIAYASMLNDAGVDVSVRAVKTPVLGAEFFVEPYSDDPNDLLAAEFTEANLFGGMSAPFTAVIEDILRFYEDGLSVLEKVYEMRSWSPSASGANSKNYTMLKKLGVRPESTISGINYDNNGGVAELLQQAIQSDGSVKEVTLPIGKTMVFTFNRRGGDVRGKSILRTAYPHWYYKTHLYKIDAIQKERHALGIPKGKLLPGWNAADRNILRTLLRNLRSNEESFIIETPNVEVSFAEVKSNLVNVLESADHHNMMIMLNVMAQFLVSTSGNRATAATQVDMFMKSLKYVANYIAEIVNMYLIPELVVYNFKTTNFPKLCVKNLGETADLQKLASAFANLLAQRAITPDLDTENFFRKTFDIPAKQPNAIPTVAAQTGTEQPAPSNNSSNNSDPQTPTPTENQPPQKGNVGNNGGQGNTGKPANAPPT